MVEMRVLERAVPAILAPNELFHRIRARHPRSFLLESRTGPRRLARFSIIGFGPREFKVDKSGADPLELVKELRPRTHPTGGRFAGGIVGSIAYEASHLAPARSRGRPPHFLLGLYPDAIVYDHARGRVTYRSTGEDRSGDVEAALEGAPPATTTLKVGKVSTTMDERAYAEGVAAIHRRLHAGETYQAVLSRRFDFKIKGDAGVLYDRLRATKPSPYMYHLDFGETQIVGSSPEMLVRVEGRRVETFPIAGTRPVHAQARADNAAKRELRTDAKENAEHLMLVDLARNDVGRVVRTGSVRVPTFRRLESYANVHHLVSHVTGTLRPDLDALDAFRSIFPAGTVTGAPKERSMEIIHELEPQARGAYAGAVAAFGFDGSLDSAITLRTLVARGDRGSVQAGAGIVRDSTPAREFAETRQKADAILRPLGVAA